MQIRSILKTAVGLVLIAFVLFGILLTSVFRDINSARENRAVVTSIMVDINNLRGLTLEYLLYPNSRIESQINAQLEDLGERINSIETPDELREDYGQLVLLVEKYINAENEESKSLISGQISIVSQRVLNDAFLLSQVSEQNTYEELRIAYFTIALYAMAQFLLIVFLTLLFYRRLLKPLFTLEKGTKIIAEGNLDHKIPVYFDDEVGQLTNSFNQMTKTLKEIDDIKTQFLNIAAHQLRTPLGIIRWNAEEIIDSKSKSVTKAKEQANEIHTSVLRMTKIISDLLSVSRIQQDSVEDTPELINLKQLTEKLIDEMSSEIKRKKLNIDINISKDFPDLFLDAEHMTQVMRNLLSNAILYNKPKGTIQITTITASKWYEIRIKDNGVGIPAEERDNIFDKFYRSKRAVSIEPDGSGLGLFIAKSHVKRWGGEIEFESSEGKGSEFIIKLPKKQKS